MIKPDTIAMLMDHAAAAKLDVASRSADPILWDQGFAKLPYQPVQFSRSIMEFFSIEAGEEAFVDLSLVLRTNGETSALWPLALTRRAGRWTLTGPGCLIPPPMILGWVTDKEAKAIHSKAQRLLAEFAGNLGMPRWHSREPFLATGSNGASSWHQIGLLAGANARYPHELYVDLQRPFDQIRQSVRKSFKPLISKGRKLWDVNIDRVGDAQTWEEVRQFHIRVAGRETRSKATWDKQFQSLKAGHAQLVYLRDQQGKLVGAGYFTLTRDEANYSIGIYDRDLFHQPLGHVVQMAAIEDLCGRGLQWLRLGERPIRDWFARPTEKEESIGAFKQGFATHWHPVPELICQTRTEQDAPGDDVGN